MQLLKEKIMTEGKVIGDDILKVDGFLNHQMDIHLFNEMGKEFKRRFQYKEINKILTIESSGIGIACITAQYFDVPVVFAKKHPGANMSKDVYKSQVYSFTKKQYYSIKVSREFVNSHDKILIIDDFLANGNAVKGLVDICNQAGAKVQGVGIAIEKGFQKGGSVIEDLGLRLESLAVIEGFADGKVILR
ncbi:MAG: xanthine phosphoribosyltransferase [Xylanivirga thermophila]|jgi:xanthine phosphoribosyltransferase|uniref:xanthine phosphoribosyltransferase n=1 Tax=Xylanivirga thermophila TaxID=2496273 RepID=UPI0039F59A22